MATPLARKTYPAEVLTPDEAQAVISACSATSRTGIRNRALLTLLYRSGLRISEAIGYPGRPGQTITLPDGQVKTQEERPAIPPLKVSDINLTAHTIRVLRTKSGKPQTRGFHPSATDALARWLDVRRQLGLNGRQAAFCTLQGEPLREQYVRGLLARLAGKAEITKRIHPHAFRHSFAVDQLDGGHPGHGHLETARPLQYRGDVPVPGSPDQRLGGRRARGRHPAVAGGLTRSTASSMPVRSRRATLHSRTGPATMASVMCLHVLGAL